MSAGEVLIHTYIEWIRDQKQLYSIQSSQIASPMIMGCGGTGNPEGDVEEAEEDTDDEVLSLEGLTEEKVPPTSGGDRSLVKVIAAVQSKSKRLI